MKLLTVAELAKCLKVHPMTVYKMVKEGRLPRVQRMTRLIRFDPKQVAERLDISVEVFSNGESEKPAGV